MKRKLINCVKVCSIFLLLTIVCPAMGQDFIIGMKYGYGNTTFTRQSDNRKTPAYSSHRASLVAEFSPYYSRLFIISGIEYEIQDLTNSLNIPLTLRIVLGNTIRPFLEGGGYFTYSLTSQAEMYTIKNDLGAKISAGLSIHLNKKWRLEAAYIYYAGFTTALEEKLLLPLDQYTLEEYRRRSGFATIGIKYRF